jgi:hypothetical protein
VVVGRYGEPLQVALGEWRWSVRQVRERWRVDDRWWTDAPVCRIYWELELESGEVLTLFQDRIANAWYRQHHQ